MSGSSVSDDNDEYDWGSDDDSSGDTSCPSRTAIAGEDGTGPSGEPSEAGPSWSKLVSHYVAMGFTEELVIKAIKDNGEENEGAILETILAYSTSDAGSSRPKLVSHYVAMGFVEELVIKAIKDNDEGDEGAILETILTYSEIEKSSAIHECSHVLPCDSEDDILSNDDFSDVENFGCETKEMVSTKDEKLLNLMEMGFNTDEASAAIGRCGPNAALSELADSISAAQTAKEYDDRLDELGLCDTFEDNYRVKKRYAEDRPCMHKKGRWMEKDVRQHKKAFRQDGQRDIFNKKGSYEEADSIIFPNPMIGFSLPNDGRLVTKRKLPEAAIGPPYFYYENVAITPKGSWKTISRFLYDIDPEFVDSKFFCAANRKRGYIHNLPIQNRFPLQPLQPRTIHEALPLTRKWWPSWDPRTHLNCLQTCIASAKLTERIRRLVCDSDGPPPMSAQKQILYQCRKWNLVWVGLNKVAPLEPDEIESLLGFPKNHTRGGGISRTERYRSLGNSFQVDTVAYHLSVLKELYPNGITVLSLFSGIGGAEVALHRLGIHMRTVVSVEISEINRNIVRGWWEQTGQTGTLIDIADVQQLTADYLEQMIHEYGGFDLVIGGSPCNNLAGSNRVSRDGLEGEHSSLFFDYFRILESVRSIMGKS